MSDPHQQNAVNAGILADYAWLASDQAAADLAEAAAAAERGEAALATLQRLRSRLTPERARLVVQQADLRRRARAKFAKADQMLFTTKLLEQATDDAVAACKAARFGDGPVVDLCCGVGGDLIAIASRREASRPDIKHPVLGVDLDPLAVQLARHNAAVCRVGAEVQLGDARQAAPPAGAWVHLDPDRRASGRRVTHWEACEPGPDCWERLLRASRGLAIKLAPATELPGEWASRCERQWIGSRGECRQQVAWCGGLARRPAGRSAAVVERLVERLVEREDQRPGEGGGLRVCELHERGAAPAFELATRLRRFVSEPHAAVRAARLAPTLAADRGWEPAAPRAALLTGDDPSDNLLAVSFEVLESCPFDARAVRRMLRRQGLERLEVKQRGLQLSPEQILRQLKVRGGSEATLIVTRLAGGVVAAVCRRLPAPDTVG